MNKGILYATVIACFAVSAITNPAFGQKKDKSKKEEEKFWKEKAKSYVKNPLSLKSETERYQNEIQNQKDRVASLEKESSDRDKLLEAAKTREDSLKWEVVQLKGEVSAQKKKYEKMELAYKSEKKAAEQDVKMGINYRVQFGSYAKDLVTLPANEKDVQHEKYNELNRYLVGNFRTQAEGDGFREEIRKLGIKDAFTVPYIDGVRVTFEEANAYLAKQGGGQPMPAGEEKKAEMPTPPSGDKKAPKSSGDKTSKSNTEWEK